MKTKAEKYDKVKRKTMKIMKMSLLAIVELYRWRWQWRLLWKWDKIMADIVVCAPLGQWRKTATMVLLCHLVEHIPHSHHISCCLHDWCRSVAKNFADQALALVVAHIPGKKNISISRLPCFVFVFDLYVDIQIWRQIQNANKLIWAGWIFLSKILLGSEAPWDLVVEDVEEEGVIVKERDLLLLHNPHRHRSEDRLILRKDHVPHDHFPRALLIPHLDKMLKPTLVNLTADSFQFLILTRETFFVFYLIVFREVEGKSDDVLHSVARGKDQLANVDGWPNSS